jgi:chromosome partitioning protein
MTAPRAQVVAISNQKGGVAKTTTCLSLGAALAEMGRPTLIVDLDPQANLTLGLGIEPEDLNASLVDLMSDPDSFSPADRNALIVHAEPAGLDLLPADVRLAAVERAASEVDAPELILKEALAPWMKKYRHILIDCPPSLGSLTQMAFTASERVLVPVQCEYFSSWGLMRLLDVTGALQRGNPPMSLESHLLATMYDARNAVHRDVYARLRATFPHMMMRTAIGVDTLLRESELVGEPILRYAPNARASQEYRKLAREWVVRTRNAEG